jgi:hypothetical protein
MRRDQTGSLALALVAVFIAHALSPVLANLAVEALDGKPMRLRKIARQERREVRALLRNQRRKTPTFAMDEPPVLDVGQPEKSPFEVRFAAYKGLGSWIDLFNHGPWEHPTKTVARMDRRGVQTIYLQTSSYGSNRRIVFPQKTEGFIRAAHARGIKVVGWSVPSFRHPNKDFVRALAGIRFETDDGDRLDSFAIDIEADIVDAIWKRNKRLLKLSDKLRARVGDDYPLGAITPDPGHALYWPEFPYKGVAKRYDVIVPMGYFTFRTKGYRGVHRYTLNGIRFIREETGNHKTPIHFIGGIADEVGTPTARAFVKALRKRRVLGGSLYDFPITKPKTWRALRRVPQG